MELAGGFSAVAFFAQTALYEVVDFLGKLRSHLLRFSPEMSPKRRDRMPVNLVSISAADASRPSQRIRSTSAFKSVASTSLAAFTLSKIT
ncbi:hypothetical protein [Mesorhizobium shangrilense]|uniref:Uncharacterized protein n=1 Tax=Mesorhizobium shangrilense TaxID=460060 RepID=A0ABV2DMI0_9HYPH